MKQTKTEVVTEERTITTDILCDRCGSSLRCKHDMNYEGLINCGIVGGYGSILGDNSTYIFDVCESCLDEWFKTFKNYPLVDVDFMF